MTPRTQFSYSVIGTGSDKFEFDAYAYHGYNYLDDVVVASSAVPEPTSLLLLGSGFSMIGLAAWRRRK